MFKDVKVASLADEQINGLTRLSDGTLAPIDEEDKQFVRIFDEYNISGTGLISGAKVPNPPEGQAYFASGGVIVLRDLTAPKGDLSSE